MRLRNKFYLLFLVSWGLVLGTVGSINFYYKRELLYRNLEERGIGLCQALSITSLNSLITSSFSEIRLYVNRIAREEDVEYILVTDSSGRVLVHSELDKENILLYDPISIKAARAEQIVEQSYVVNDKKIYEIAFPIKVGSIKWGMIRIGFNLEKINRQLMMTTLLFLLFASVVVSGASFFFLFIGDKIVQPIKALIAATHEVSRGNFSIKIPEAGKDEVGSLSRAFNLMTNTLKKEKKALKESNKKSLFYNERLKKKVKDLSIINHAIRSLRQALNISKKFDLILNLAIYLSKASGGCLFSLSDEFSKPALRAKKGSNINLERCIQLSHKVFKTQRPMAYAYGKILQIKLGHPFSQRSNFKFIAYPLKAKNTVWGFVVLEKTEGIFAKDELQTLFTFLDEVNLITESSLLTKVLLESRQLDSFNKLTSVLLHDLKGAIAQLSLSLQNAEKNYSNPQFREDFLATISDSIKKLHKLTERIGERPDFLKLVPYRISQLLREVVDELGLRRYKGIRLQESYEEISPILVDPQNIKRVFHNIIINALEAMPEGGLLQIRTYKKESAASVCVDVEDSGVGMTRDFVENHLFKPFRSTKQRGLGIALYSSKEIINLHGGKIFVKSYPGKGTKFTIKLPFLTQYKGKRYVRRYLGQYLLEMGAITEDQLKKAMQIQAQRGKKIGKILIDMGYIRRGEVFQALQKQKSAERRMLETLIKDHL